MFNGLIAALISMMLSFSPNNATHEKETHASNSSSSYFFFDSDDHITIHLDVGENPGVESANVSKKYSLQGDVQIPGCIVVSNEISTPIDITDKKYIDFGVKVTPSCNAQTLTVSGQKILHNSVVSNGKVYEAQKKEKFGPVLLHNKVQNESLFITIAPEDGKNEMPVDSTKQIIYKIVNDRQEQVEPGKIESLSIRSLDGEKILLEQNQTLTTQMNLPPSSYGTFVIKSTNRPGIGKIEIDAVIKSSLKKRAISSIYTITIKPKPVVETTLKLETSKEVVSPYDLGSLDYRILQDGEIANASAVDRIEFYIAYGSFVKDDGTSDKMVIQNSSSGTLYFRPNENTKLCKITMIAYMKNGKRLIKEIELKVSDIALNQISINPVGTEYNATTGLYITTYYAVITGDLKDKTFHVDAISPKILYPEAYYFGFITGELDFDNPAVYYEGIKAVPYESGESYSGKIFNEGLRSYFGSDKYDMRNVKEGVDKLIVLPNKYNTDKQILGSWSILDIRSDNTLTLKEKSTIEKDRLSFVIGDQTRYDPVHYTIATISLDHPDGLYRVDNAQTFKFKVSYPPFMVGKDIFISIKQKGEHTRFANAYKRTLMGTQLSYPKEFDCKRNVCPWRITIKQKESGERLRYTRLEYNCVGHDASYSVRSAYDIDRYGCTDTANLQTPRTNRDGYVYLCVYPKGKVSTDKETNKTKVDYKGSVTCEFEIKEEFPY